MIWDTVTNTGVGFMDETGDLQTSQSIQLFKTPTVNRHGFSYIQSGINRNRTHTTVTNICLNVPGQRIFLELLTTVPVADAISFFPSFYIEHATNSIR